MTAAAKRWAVGCGLGVFAAAWPVVALTSVVWLNLPTNQLVHRWDQPTGVTYGSFEPYTVYVLEGSRRWNVLGPVGRRHDVWVAKSTPGLPDHGHLCEYQFHMTAEPPDDYVRSCTATWAPDGVTLAEPTGHRLFIPKSAFVGGR